MKGKWRNIEQMRRIELTKTIQHFPLHSVLQFSATNHSEDHLLHGSLRVLLARKILRGK